MSAFTFPPASFFFNVNINGENMQFQEVSGLDVEMEVFDVAEGGINDYKHRLPGRTTYKNLVLKRGLVYSNTKIYNWVKNTLQNNLNNKINTKPISVSLFNENKEEIVTWNFLRAYPVKWSVSNLNAEQNAIAIETIEFAYQKFTIEM